MPAVDPITVQVIRNALKAAAEEMQTSLIKTAHNPLIYEVQDFGVTLTNQRGELLAEGSGLPGFLGCLPPTIQSGLKVIGAENFAEGDILLTNEPYDTARISAIPSFICPSFTRTNWLLSQPLWPIGPILGA
jgi:N-methylhydantoinase B